MEPRAALVETLAQARPSLEVTEGSLTTADAVDARRHNLSRLATKANVNQVRSLSDKAMNEPATMKPTIEIISA